MVNLRLIFYKNVFIDVKIKPNFSVRKKNARMKLVS